MLEEFADDSVVCSQVLQFILDAFNVFAFWKKTGEL